MKHFDIRYIAAAAAVIAGFAVTSCEDEPDKFRPTEGVPTVYYIRPVDVNASDSLMTGAYMDNQICIVGDNLRSVYRLLFNDQEAVLNTSLMTDNTLIVTVPSTIPGVVSDKMYMITASRDTVAYDFSVIVPGPTVSSMSCEYADAGSVATLYGNYFVDDPNVPLEITFSGDVPVTEIQSISMTQISFVVPAGAEEGPVTVSTIYGEQQSYFHYLDSRGFLFDFDGGTGLSNHGWHNRTIQDTDGIRGNYVQLGDGATALDADGGWNDGQFAFEYWPGDWSTPTTYPADGLLLTELVDFSDFANMSLKFEMYIPSSNPWSSGTMQLIFAGTDKVSYGNAGTDIYGNTVAGANNTYFQDDVLPRGFYRPWSNTGSFDTDDEWITVTVPFSDFTYGFTGAQATGTLSADDFTSLNIFVVGGGLAGTECTPIIRIDNIRAVPNR